MVVIADIISSLDSDSDLLQVQLIIRWSTWFLSLPSGEHKVSLWISWCGKSVPLMTRSYVIPLLFMLPHFRCILSLFLTVVGQCIALDDSGVDGPPLHSDLHQLAVGFHSIEDSSILFLMMYNTVSPVLVLTDPIYLLSLIPRMWRL